MTDSNDDQFTRVRAERDAYQQELAQREEQLASQPQIEQAKGILMRDLGLEVGEAFALLVLLSQQSNIKLRVVAAHVVQRYQRQTTPATGATVSRVLAALGEQLRRRE